MSDELSTVEKAVEDVLIDLMAERVMSERRMSAGVQASSTGGIQASPSTAHGAGPSRTTTETRTKHRDDIANAKLIPRILPTYIPPLSGGINHDSVPRDFEYTLITAYLPKGVHAVRADQDKLAALKFSDFNLGDRKVYSMLSPHKYLTKMKGKNSKIVPQSWTQNLAQSTLLNVMKIPHFGRHQEVNACIKLLLSCYHRGYLWLNRCITVDPTLINRITGLSMQGPDPQEFYPGKTSDRALAQKIKETYGDVEKGTRGYKVASIQSGTVHLSCQLIAGKLVHKNRPTQVTRFMVDLAGKCAEGLQMNWAQYLVNQLEIDCREAQDQGYDFHFSWLLILITFIAWELPEGATFPDIEPFEPLAAKFCTLWYSSDMRKQWQCNVVFHAYYNQLKIAIQSTPRITPNTLYRFRPLMKFSVDHHFTYITTRADEHKQQLQSYYKLTEDDLEEITKEWSADLLVPVDPAEMSDVDSPETMPDTPGPSKTKKNDEVHDVHSTSVETSSTSPEQGDDGGELGGMKVEQNKGKVTPPRDEEDPTKKRKVTPPKPSSRKKSRATRATFKTTLTSDDFDFLVAALNDASLEITEKKEAKQEEVFSRIKGEL
jgi:hypothetical protein